MLGVVLVVIHRGLDPGTPRSSYGWHRTPGLRGTAFGLIHFAGGIAMLLAVLCPCALGPVRPSATFAVGAGIYGPRVCRPLRRSEGRKGAVDAPKIRRDATSPMLCVSGEWTTLIEILAFVASRAYQLAAQEMLTSVSPMRPTIARLPPCRAQA